MYFCDVLKYTPLLISVVWLFASCKVQQPTSTTEPDPVADQNPASDTTRVVIAEEIPDTVEIKVHRVLPNEIRIMGVGDMMIGTAFPDTRYLPPDSGRTILSFVADTLRQADLLFGNLEGVLLDGEGTPKNCRNPDKCYVFRMPSYNALRFKEAGFDLLSVANNHSGDFGEEGRASTEQILNDLDIQFAGFDSKPFTIFRKGAIRYGFAAFAPNKGTASLHDIDSAISIVKMLDSMVDIVIVSFHGGAEGSSHEHVPRTNEIFYGEDRGDVYAFSHRLIDAGADIIFGHGPHVARAIEVYNDRFIAYSLGNFATYSRFNLRGPNAFAPIADIIVAPDGAFMRGRIISAIQTGLGIPKIDPQHRAAKKIKALSEVDFPEATIYIEGSGGFSYIQQ